MANKALFTLSETQRNMIDNEEVTICSRIDTEGAFDNTSH